jgi:quinol monooxygenase YgiN
LYCNKLILFTSYCGRKSKIDFLKERGKNLVIITIEIEVPSLKTKEFLQTMLVVTQRIRMENGCIECDFLKDLSDDKRYRIVGKWKGKDELKKHLRSEEFSVVRGAMSLLENKPDIRVYVVSSQQEMDNLQKKAVEPKSNNLKM